MIALPQRRHQFFGRKTIYLRQLASVQGTIRMQRLQGRELL
jgi:hypothetical protein